MTVEDGVGCVVQRDTAPYRSLTGAADHAEATDRGHVGEGRTEMHGRIVEQSSGDDDVPTEIHNCNTNLDQRSVRPNFSFKTPWKSR